MRKKISSILMGILLIFAGVFISACGDKYKDFEFKISYALSENAETWYDAKNGINLNYSLDDETNEYVFSINGNEERVSKGNFNIYFKAEVENVKSKHLDSITISAEGASGLAFSSSTIKPGKVVTLPVVGLVNSQLSLYENKSGRSTKIGLSVYGKIKDITRNDAITPAIVVGGTLDLNSTRDIIIYNKDGIVTNQTGVTYKFIDFGKFTSAGKYQADTLSNNQLNRQFLSFTSGKLKLNQKIGAGVNEKKFVLTDNNNVVHIKATSNYSPVEPTADNPEITTDIYVYIVDGSLTAPRLTFDGTEINVNKHTDESNSKRGIDLYFNGVSQYANSTIKVSGLGDSVYKNGVTTADGRILRFKVKAYIGNLINKSYVPYEFGSDIPVRNLKITENGDKYTLTLVNQSSEKFVDVKFAYELVCEEGENTYPITFTSSKPVLETNVEVRKHILASSIVIGGEEYRNGDSLNGVVDSSSHKDNFGYTVELGVEPLDSNNPQTIEISGIEKLNVLNKKGFKVNNNDKLANGEVLKIKFAPDENENQTVNFKVLKAPTYFNGKAIESFASDDFISVNLNLEKKITADALEIVDGNDFSKVVSTSNVATTVQSYVFVKAYYSGSLNVDTITLSSDNFALNSNGDKQIKLTDETLVVDGNDNKGYKIFKVAIPATESSSTSKLTVYAGEFGNGASTSVTLNSVDLINNAENIKISVKNKNDENVTDLENNKFVVVKGKDVSFNVVEVNGSDKIEKTIQKVTLTGKTIDGTNADKFGGAEVLTKTEFGDNTFSIYGWNAKTRVFDVNVEYYAQNPKGVVSLHTKTISNVQFAVYNPITSITIIPTRDKIAYVHPLLINNASTTEISYTLHSGVNETPTDTVYFIDNEGNLVGKTGATSVNVSINRNLSNAKLFYSTGSTYVEINNNSTTLREKVSGNGTIILQLINSTLGENNIKFVVTANRFEKETTIANDVTIRIANVEKATGINIVEGDIEEYSNENRELQLSFMGVASGEISKTFVVEPVFTNKIPDANTLQFKGLVWELYKYNYVNGNWELDSSDLPITNFENSISVVNNNGEFTIVADKAKEKIGGLYKLIIATEDSYALNADNTGYEYKTKWSIDVRVQDGKSSDSAYVLTSYKDFEKVKDLDITKIDADLDAYYVLGNNITIPAGVLDKPIGYDDKSGAKPFTGELMGRFVTSTSEFNFNLNVTVGNNFIVTTSDYKNVYGLFSILEGRISNLNINIIFSSDISTNGISTIGGIVAVNKGTIENVNVTLIGENITINNATNFGGIVGVNEGEILSCVVNSSQGIIINAKAASNIGGIVGENKGTIFGQYQGKKSLDTIKYDNIANITVNNSADNIAYNIGAVAGTSSEDITNMLVGGQIIFNSTENTAGYLAGIVGSTSKDVSTVAVVGLDIINKGKNGINVAGIAGEVTNSTSSITDAKFVSVLAKFASFTAKGELVGKTVAGISHNANVTYSTVESFIKTVEDVETGLRETFYTFEGETVYGLIGYGSVSNSFVSANINSANAFLTSNTSSESATYFIGKVNGDTITDVDIKSTYAVIINEENTNATLYGFAKQLSEFATFVKADWEDNIKNKHANFTIDENINILNVSDYEGVDYYLPYIYVTLEDGSTTPLMILQPDSIKAEINQDYQIDVEENIYVGDVNIKDDETNPTYEIKESIVVDFFENKYDNYGNLDVNKHKLVNDGTDDGLIDLTMLPANVTAGLTFELVANYGDIARIKDNTYLILTGASNLQPIILRAYSMFNPEAEAYFAIYSQRTFSELILEGNNVTKLDEQDYVVNVYQGRNSTIALKADNFKGGQSYDSILTNNSHMVKVEGVIDETNLKFDYNDNGEIKKLDKFSFNTNNLSSVIISINENYNAQPNDEFDVILNVYLSEEYFNGLNDDLLLDTIKLKVNLNNVATKLDIVGANDFEIDSSSTLNFKASLKTGFVNDIQHQECSVEVDDNGVVIVDKNHVDTKDSIRMNIYSTSVELIRIKTETGAKSFAELFNYNVYETKTADGYNYEVSLALKDEFNFRYVTSNIDLVVNIWAASNPNVMNAVNVTIKPTTANTTRLSSYNVEGVNVVSNTKSELTLGQVESSIISPGGRGNMLLAYVEKSYSNIDSISITSSDLFVPELNKNVNLVFTQYVYNKSTRKFETLFNSNVQAQNGKTLELQKVTTIENGKTEYTGILYIHAQLIKVSGLEARISATLNVVSNGISIPAKTVDMLTTFLPGASLTYSGIVADNGGYLVQESTYGNTARIKLYGYQFNSNPTMIVDWELVDGVDYFYKLNPDKNIQIDLSVISDVNADGSADDEKIAKLKDYFDKGTLYYSIGGKYYKATEESHYKTLTNTFYSISNKKVIEKDGKTYNIADYVSTYFLKQYDKVEYNSVDGSYSMEVLFNIAKDMPANFSLQASMSLITSDGQFENSASEKIMFYPTKYVVTGLSVKDTAGNKKMLAINRTDKIQLLFNTLRGDYDFSAAIYDEFFIKHIADLKELFKYFDITEKTFKDANSAFKVDFKNNYLSITGLSTFEKEITLSVYVGYEFKNGKYEIVFGEQGANNVSLLTYSFTLQIYPGATEENANPIYSASDMVDENGNSRLAQNGHYILMNDITLDLVKPIENIASLDGNNHIIKIKNFVIDPSKTEYGLFANIGTYQDEEGKTHKSILKNVVVDYSEFNVENSGNIEFINNNMTTIKFGGLVATNNGGLIYNCDVINSNASRDKVINIHVDENASITFGGLVASNLGVITNSRVGRREFKDIDAVNDTYANTTFGGLEFVLGSETKSGFDAVAGGFVGENSGTISSSYFANSSLVNYSNSNETNITAGFAGVNISGASIVYSYVKAKETTITSVQPNSTGNRIENKSNGIVAGFVYENAGTITDSYANTELYTDSTYMSGFVYENLSGGEIRRSYAACTMKKESGEAQNNAQQPFVGRDNENKYLNAGTMENNYYLLNTDGSGDIRQTFALALNATNFKNPNNLQGFVFIQSNVKEEREQGVWSHIDTKGNALILPELMNANVIATSAKYLLSDDKDENGITKYTYTNASSVSEGTQYNPYIIRNVQEFNATLTGNRDDMSDRTSKSGYIRLIDSINFGEDGDAIKTRINYTLGDEYRANITSFEGNGLNIEGIYFDNPQTQTNEMGLFAKIENAYVKNVNLSFVTPKNGVQYGTTNVKYSGGVAGIITNSAIINVNLDGSDVSLTGQNYVGGVAGLVNGDSLLYGITSNLSVSADSAETGLYYSEEDYIALGNYNHAQHISNLSYAGGIAGVIDVTKRAGTDYNVSFIDVYGDQMFVKATEQQLPNIEGQYAGGIAGFAGSNVSALKLKYHTGASDWIRGSEAAGGIFAVSLGKIMASQVTAVEDTQFEYDTEFGKYVLNVEKGLDKTKVGNLNLIESNGYAGGLIGIGLYAGVDASYAKAGFRNGKVIGGLIGLSVASKVTYSYAVPFVNLTEKTKEVGGLIGSAHVVEKGFNYNSDPLSKYKELVKVYLNRDAASSSIAYTDIQYTFSTVLVERSLLIDNSPLSENGINCEDLTNSPIQIGYLVPNSFGGSNENALRSGGNNAYLGVFEGGLDAYSYTPEEESKAVYPIFTTEKSKKAKLDVMYNLAHTSQETTFNEVFASWKVISYWSLNNEKYFPLLINDYVDNYTLISKAEDFKMLESNPDGKFKVIQDINMGTINSNWVIYETFTGELIGEIDTETQERKKIYNISLNPNQADTSSGFFKATKGAIISDLEFVWNDAGNEDDGAINSSVNLTDVSGLSCFDEYAEDGENTEFSEFNNVEVRVSGGGYLIKPGASNITINKFGGIVATTKNSTIIGCDFVGKVDAILKNHPEGETTAYFGGLVGKAEKIDTAGNETVENSSMSIMNSKVGANGENTSKPTTEFTIAVNGTKQAFIGGAIGHITNASVLGVSVGSVKYVDPNYQAIDMNVNISDSNESGSSQNIAGLIGYSYNSAINVSDAYVNITVSGGSYEQSHNYNTTIAGLIGTYHIQTDKVNEQEKDEEGNIISTKKVNVEIANSNAKTNIDVAELKTSTLLVSGGVGSLTSINTLSVIKQCLFTGSIVGENEDATKQTQAAYIYAGGAIAKTSGSAEISETMTSVDVTIGATNDQFKILLAGGFVGNVSGNGATLTLENVVSSGKLVPFCGDDATKVHLGGMVGSVDDNVTSATITNAYTVTSIIADAIAGKALPNTSSDALVGYAVEGKVQTTNVYYSTDFALTSNDHDYGVNIAGSDFIFSTNDIWKTEFVGSSDAWKLLAGVSDGYLPYIKALEDSLKVYKVLQIDSTGKHNYVEGTSLRPKIFSGAFDNEFTYYILNDASAPISGILKGVLIGKDAEFTDVETGNLISKIGKHSAVSNIHLNIKNNSKINLMGGFIAETNNGLIFNCSIQGKGINIVGSIGVIAGANNGTISHSYSGIEILNSGAVAGIAYTNNSVINSCYFTGYINSNNASAGIMLNATGDAYVYNNYMAGVITEISSTGTSFFAGNIADFDGKNNYVDQFANNELGIDLSRDIGTQNEYIVLKSVSTAELMSRIGDDYKGTWYTTVNSSGEIITTTVEEDKTINGTFGYNYGYPIYKFNKLGTNVVAVGKKCSDIEYSLYTGTGVDTSEDLASRYTNIHTSLYENAYKIPHLGVMTAVHGLQGDSRNYVVIYDINGSASRKDDGAMIEWNGICSTTEINEGFKSTGAFKGVLVTNKNLNPTEITAGSHICKIEGLNKSGLFNEIGKSYIADITLGNFGEIKRDADGNPTINGLTNSGAIGNTIKKPDDVTLADGETLATINNINFADDSVIVGNDFGGLFGSVQSTVTISNFKSNKKSDTDFAAVTLQGTGSAGLIAYSLGGKTGEDVKSGTIDLITNTTITPATPTNQLYPFFEGVETAGGLVGTAVAGTINGNKNIVHINNNATETIGSYGGIIGTVLADATNVIVKGIVVEFADSAVVTANSFGGFVSKVAGTVTFDGCSIQGTSVKINSQSSEESKKGLLVGEISATEKDGTPVYGNVTIKGFVLEQEIELVCTGANNDNSSIGGFVGTQNGDFTLEIETPNAITIKAQDTPNLGGIIGIYNKGNINVTGNFSTITLEGCKNVGGFIGQANAWPTIGVTDEEGNIVKEPDTIDFLDRFYATIKIGEFAKENFGGLFGLLKAGNDVTTLATNRNKFDIKAEGGDNTVSNIGGIAGCVDNKEAKFNQLVNNESITASKTTKYQFKNVGGIFGNFNGASIETAQNKGSISFVADYADAILSAETNASTGKVEKFAYSIAINIGGIIGLADNATENAFEFTGLTNSGAVSGYQNVGGLIGYANKINVRTDKTTNTTSGAIAGVINVGGAFGCVQESELQSITSTAKVYGNTNVGGLIGLSNNNTLIGNTVGGETAPDNTKSDEDLNDELTTIKAIYYNVYKLESKPADYVSYIPTGVGGLIGASQKTTIESNTVRNVRVISTDEGKETGKANSESKGIISTNKNYMANAGSGEGSGLTDGYLKSEYIPLTNGASNKQPFAKLTSGFGGFIGTLDNTDNLSSDSKIINLAIKAPLGINVGTFYGFYNHEGELNAPTLYGTINVDGAYNVGGLAGKTTGTIGSISNGSLQGTAKINLQSKLSGMYVGGLFGELNSNDVSDIKVVDSSVDIVIYTNLSYYIGGLVGKLSVSSGNIFKGEVATIDIVATNNDNAQNFGGLVGMFKITGDADNVTYSVNGKHMFPFTVNTIENQNYAEGSSQFGTEVYDSNYTVHLLAQAYYVNQDSFNISSTSNTDVYDVGKNNPLRPSDSTGWAQGYTGFKQVQRCIPANKNNDEWDSIAVVYNAENITHVATISNQFNGNVPIPEDGVIKQGTFEGQPYYYYNGDSGEIKLHEQFIIYTVYEKAFDMPLLYCPMGIAELARTQDGEKVTPSSNAYTSAQEKDSKDRTGLDEYYWERSAMDPQFAGTNQDGSPKDKSRTKIENVENLLRFDWIGKIGEVTWYYKDGEKIMARTKDALNSAYYYELDGDYYDFKVIYANATWQGVYGTAVGPRTQDVSCPKSGSVFEISGMNPSLTIYDPTEAEDNDDIPKWLQWVFFVVGLIAAAAAIICSYGAATPFVAAIWGVLGIGMLVATGIFAFANGLFESTEQGNQASATLYYNTYDQNLGLMTTTTMTEIKYKNGKMNAEAIDVRTLVEVDGSLHTYQYYSKVKPSDYYTNYYITSVITEEEFNANKSVTKGLSKNEINKDENEDGNMIYPLKDGGSGQIYKYSFHYGTTQGTEVNAYAKYIFMEGAYYLNTLGFKYNYYPTQELSNVYGIGLQDTEMVYADDGLVYIRGQYDSTGTTMNNIYTHDASIGQNLMIGTYGSFTLNGEPISDSEAYKDVEQTFVEDTEGLYSPDGYNCIQGAYHTANGTKSGNAIKFATFKKMTSEPEGTIGIDKLQYTFTWQEQNGTDAAGNPIYNNKSQTVWYKITSVKNSNTGQDFKDNTAVPTSVALASDIPQNIYINLYPKSFHNPYEVSIGNVKDDTNYVNYQNVKGGKIALTTNVRYFYFENGYLLGKDLRNSPYSNPIDSAYDDFVYVPTDITADYKDVEITLFNSSNSKKSVKYSELFTHDGSKYTGIDNTYEDYYVTDISEIDEEELKNNYKVKNYYAVAGGKIYQRKDIYSIKNGKLNKLFKYNTKEDSDRYKINLYCSNEDWALYTMFKYCDITNGFKFDESTTKWTDSNGKKYYLIPLRANASRPNSYTTYLVETAKVSLGGGFTLNYTGKGEPKVGTISIETPIE